MSITLREGNKAQKEIKGKEEILPKGISTPKAQEPAENKIVDKPQEISYNNSNKESGYVGFENVKPKSQNSKPLNGVSFLEAGKNEAFLKNRYKFGPQFNEWLKKNHDAIKYSGDNTFNNIKNTMEKDVPRFMQDAPYNVDKNGLISSLVKWNLADKAGNKDLKDKAVKNTIGYMSEENQEEYLKDQQPLEDYVKASDDYDHQRGNFKTTEYSTSEPDEDVMKIQNLLVDLDYRNKYDEPIKVDGLSGSNTLFAVDTYWENTKPKRRNSLTSNNKHKTAIIDGKEYKVEYPLATLEDLKPKMLTNEELRSLYSNYNSQLTSYKNNTEYNQKLKENAETNEKSIKKVKNASEIIVRNANTIKELGKKYGVNPAIIAACIYTEQVQNVNMRDSLTDSLAYFMDTSIGIGQVKVSTAKLMEDLGYIEKTGYLGKRQNWHGNSYIMVDYWNVPGYGIVEGSREKAISKRLTNDKDCIEYVAAYLKYLQDRWKDEYPEIDGRTAILATLFNQKETRPPHPNPEPNPFGEKAKENYYYMQHLLDIE